MKRLFLNTRKGKLHTITKPNYYSKEMHNENPCFACLLRFNENLNVPLMFSTVNIFNVFNFSFFHSFGLCYLQK